MTTRRRVLTILAGIAALPVVCGASGRSEANAGVQQWRGMALGAEARIVLDHPHAGTLIPRAVAEIHRLEKIFSLYLPGSELSRLNREAELLHPAFELVELLSICSRLHARTGGAFDPTVQTLWSLYAERYSKGQAPKEDQIARARMATGWEQVDVSAEKISLGLQNLKLTLNGIAQGYIADRVTEFLRRNGVANVLVNTGEIAALGLAPDGLPWAVKLDDGAGKTIPLSNAAIATSAPLGTAFDDKGTAGHIFDPRTGKPGGKWNAVTVVSETAAEADGLSTAFCLMDRSQIMAAKGNAEVYLR